MQQSRARRQASFLVLFAFTFLHLLLVFVAYTGKNPAPVDQGLKNLCYGVAAVGFLAAIFYSMARIKPELEPPQLHLQMLISLCMTELPSIFAWTFLGIREWQAYAPVAGAAIAVNLLFIAPRIVAYWSTRPLE